MENDSVRSVGESTLVDLWIEGKFRAITVSRDAIDSFLKLSPDSANAFTDSDRVEFVRTHLAVIVKAASDQLRNKPGADTIVIDAGQLSGAPRAEGGDRRRGDRRQGERRKRNLGPPAGIERRRS